MPFLIDGYNLLHATGQLSGRVGPHGLEKARASLLGLLTAVHGPDADDVTLVYDARHAPQGARGDEPAGPIQVIFAIGREADDQIEELIAHDSAPKRLTVVSDDRRIQTAARRRKCIVWGCEQYLTWLDRRRRARTKPAVPEKPTAVSDAELATWLSVFVPTDNRSGRGR